MRRDAQNKPPRPSNSPSRCLPAPGVTSHGAKALTRRCIPASPSCAFGPRIGITGARNPMPKNGCSSNGRRAKARQPNTGSRPCRRIRPSQPSLQPLNCAGGSSATIRNSSRNSGSITTKDEAGEAFTTTWRSASRPTDPGLRTEFDSPLRRQNPRHQSAWPIPWFSTPRIRPSEPNAISKRQSQPSALSWPATSPGAAALPCCQRATYEN